MTATQPPSLSAVEWELLLHSRTHFISFPLHPGLHWNLSIESTSLDFSGGPET